jgi:hypothetical protein
MPPNDFATTQAAPRCLSASAACSREEPLPKPLPATTTSPGLMRAAKLGSTASRQCAAITSIGLFM